MNIKQLTLNDFQKHEHLIIDFSSGVNVIYGKTDSGKSTIIRAIRWALYPNELRGDVVRRENSKKTSVKIVSDTGVIIERIKTSSTNSYKLTVGEEVKEFNATGNKLPEEIAKIIGFAPIEVDKDNLILNISNQLAMPFLMNKSGSYRQKLLNKLSGNDIIDNTFQGLNRDILQVGRDVKNEKEKAEELITQLDLVKTDKDKLAKIHSKFEILLISVKEKKKRYEKLTSLLSNLEEICEGIRACKEKIRTIKIISKDEVKVLEQKIIRFSVLKVSSTDLNKVDIELVDVSSKLKSIIIPKIDTRELSKKIDKFIGIEKLNKKLAQINIEKEKIGTDLNEVINKLKTLDDKYKKLLKSMVFCPFYKVKCPLNKEMNDEK